MGKQRAAPHQGCIRQGPCRWCGKPAMNPMNPMAGVGRPSAVTKPRCPSPDCHAETMGRHMDSSHCFPNRACLEARVRQPKPQILRYPCAANQQSFGTCLACLEEAPPFPPFLTASKACLDGITRAKPGAASPKPVIRRVRPVNPDLPCQAAFSGVSFLIGPGPPGG